MKEDMNDVINECMNAEMKFWLKAYRYLIQFGQHLERRFCMQSIFREVGPD